MNIDDLFSDDKLRYLNPKGKFEYHSMHCDFCANQCKNYLSLEEIDSEVLCKEGKELYERMMEA